jgi:hypothetical protein
LGKETFQEKFRNEKYKGKIEKSYNYVIMSHRDYHALVASKGKKRRNEM